MSKETRTVSIDPDVDRFLDKEGVNASSLVNKLVKNHATSGGDDRAMLELRKEQIESEIEELESRVEQKRSELSDVQDRLDEYTDDREDIVAEAVAELEGTPADPDNPAIRNWAQKADLSPAEFAETLEQQRTQR